MISYYFQLFQSNIINFCLELFIYPNLIIDIIFQKFYFNVKKIIPFQRTSLIPNKRRIRNLGRRTSFFRRREEEKSARDTLLLLEGVGDDPQSVVDRASGRGRDVLRGGEPVPTVSRYIRLYWPLQAVHKFVNQ